MLKGNAVIGQSGGPTSVINASMSTSLTWGSVTPQVLLTDAIVAYVPIILSPPLQSIQYKVMPIS